MSIDEFLGKRHNQKDYNCAQYACDVLSKLTGRSPSKALASLLLPPEKRRANWSELREMRILKEPEEPCLVWFRGRKEANHVGVWHEGKVLHLPERSCAQYVPLSIAGIGYDSIRFISW